MLKFSKNRSPNCNREVRRLSHLSNSTLYLRPNRGCCLGGTYCQSRHVDLISRPQKDSILLEQRYLAPNR